MLDIIVPGPWPSYRKIHKGSYMGAHVLLNVLNELVKSDNFSNEFNKFNNTGARMLDSIYHMSFKVIHNRILA